MRIKKYSAQSMREALLQIKEDLGENAMILNTRRIPKKLFQFGESSGVEVTAAIDDNLLQKSTFPSQKRIEKTGGYVGKKQSGNSFIKSSSPTFTLAEPAPVKPPPEYPHQNFYGKEWQDKKKITGKESFKENKSDLDELRGEVREMKKLLSSISVKRSDKTEQGFTGPWATLYKRLVDSEIKEELAEELIKDMKNGNKGPDKDINRILISAFSKNFPVSGPLSRKYKGPLIIAMIGPTGSGKTTTIAKLAAHYSLNEGCSVSIITTDTYRIAAIDQIRTFAEIADIRFSVVFSPDEVPDILNACRNDDIIFVDTAGRSQRNMEHVRNLEEFFSVLHPDESHLVLSATTKSSDLKDMINRYRGIQADRLLFTKLDETIHLGNVFNIVSENHIPVSYLAYGQNVPDDIELARPARFAERLMEGTSV